MDDASRDPRRRRALPGSRWPVVLVIMAFVVLALVLFSDAISRGLGRTGGTWGTVFIAVGVLFVVLAVWAERGALKGIGVRRRRKAPDPRKSGDRKPR